MPKLKMTIFVIRNCYPDKTVPKPIKQPEFWVELKMPTNGATYTHDVGPSPKPKICHQSMTRKVVHKLRLVDGWVGGVVGECPEAKPSLCT